MNRSVVTAVALLLVGAGLGAAALWATQPAPVMPPPVAEAPPEVVQQQTPAPAPPVRPRADKNLVLVIGCTLRRDQLTPYGGHPEASPMLASLAEQGVRFDDGFSAAPWTKAASTAIMTGQHPISVGMVEPEDHANRRRLAPQVDTLAELLSEAGFQTFGATANPNTNGIFGFDQGFDDYDEVSDLWRKGEMRKVRGKRVVERVLGAVDEKADGRPLYLQLMLIDAHAPVSVGKAAAKKLWEPGLPKNVAVYRAMVRQFDEAVRSLVEGLEARGLNHENTTIVVVNDHGEGLRHPWHHGYGHGNFLYTSTTEMPFILSGGPVAEGVAAPGLVSQVDVAPTLLGLMGASGYEGPGRDWSAVARGEVPATDREQVYLDTWFQHTSRTAMVTPQLACHHDWNQVANEEGELRVPSACYDRATDRLAEKPLDGNQEQLKALQDWRAGQQAVYEAYPHTADADFDADIAAQLEALGYLSE